MAERDAWIGQCRIRLKNPVKQAVFNGSLNRVRKLAADREHVEAGEILVAPFTDPAWSPYFLPAAGVVMDLGGILSHGSIIAREYGIPAVVNIGPAPRIIKTGQMLGVDGDCGVVTILDEILLSTKSETRNTSQ